MKKIFSLILLLAICFNTFGQNILVSGDTTIYIKPANILIKLNDMILKFNTSNNPQNCEVSFEGLDGKYEAADCELVMNNSLKGFRSSEEFKSIQKQLLAKGYGVDTTGVLDLKTIKAYANYKKNKIGEHPDVGIYLNKKVYLDTSSYEKYMTYSLEDIRKYKDTMPAVYIISAINGWQKLKNEKGKCTGYYVKGKKPKTYKIPCAILDSRQNFSTDKIKGLQYKLSDLGYDLDVNGVFNLETLEAYKDYEKKKKRNKKKK